MGKIEYFGTWEDSWAIVEDFFARGDLRAYWDVGRYDEPNAKPFTHLTPEVKALLRETRGLYIFGSFSTHPPLFRRQQTGIEAGKYFLSQGGGGPLISFFTARENVVDGQLLLLDGDISTQPYYELEPKCYVKPSDELKAAYADLVKRMKKHLVRWEGLWISPAALQLLKEGKAELPGVLKPLGALARAAKTLQNLKAVPPSSTKTARGKVAARSATT